MMAGASAPSMRRDAASIVRGQSKVSTSATTPEPMTPTRMARKTMIDVPVARSVSVID